MGVIFDLDQTLIDSKIAEPFRNVRDWQKVYGLIPSFKEYTNIRAVLDFIDQKKIPIAVVSTSPSTYCNRVLKHWNIPHNCVIGYHDAQPKPSPAPMLKALDILNLKANNVISFGDAKKDIDSSKAAGIKVVGCKWGTSDALEAYHPDFIAEQPIDVIDILVQFFKL